MPKMFVHSVQGTFSRVARSQIAKALTDLGMRCENLIDSKLIRRGIWVFFDEHHPDSVFSGGEAVTAPQIALVAYAIRGGFNDSARTQFIAEATAILRGHAATSDPATPIYVVIQETPAADWGMYGKQVELENMQKNRPSASE
ncbi:tautomerase family protein [Rhizobium brockwellii]|uniref:tautomerase family protein n=1 Tax=Rhizobium brockwellii TaxID=3019932 RepID=UPI003F9DFD22